MEIYKGIKKGEAKTNFNFQTQKSLDEIRSVFMELRQRINEVTYPIQQVSPTLFLDFVNEFLEVAMSSSPKGRVFFLVGPPGTGKTWFAEKLSEVACKVFYEYMFGERADDDQINEFLGRLERMSSSFNNEFINDQIDSIKEEWIIKAEPTKSTLDFLNLYLDYIEGVYGANAEQIGKKLVSLASFLINLSEARGTDNIKRIVEFMQENTGRATSVVRVVPSREDPASLIVDRVYVVNKPSDAGEIKLIEETEEVELLQVISDLYEGKMPMVVLVLDEITEMIKKEEKTKSLHPFLDHYLGKRAFYFSVDTAKLSEKTKQFLQNISKAIGTILSNKELMDQLFSGRAESLEEQKELIDAVLDGNRTGHVEFMLPLPLTFWVFATGNERDEMEMVGLLDSTKQRLLSRHRFNYPTPEQMDDFVDYIVDALSSHGKSHELKTFADNLKARYRDLFEEYRKNKSEFVGMLPTFRTTRFFITAYLAFLHLHNYFSNVTLPNSLEVSLEYEERYEEKGRTDTVILRSSQQNASVVPVSIGSYQEFLLKMFSLFPHIPVASFMLPSEVGAYEETERFISELLAEEGNPKTTLANFFQDPGIVFDIGKKDTPRVFLLKRPYLLYLMYTLSSLVSGQKFALYIGTTGEGKSTMAREILPYFIKSSDIHTALGYTDVDVRTVQGSSLEVLASNVEEAGESEKKKLAESQIISILREAQKNKHKLYIVVIDEVNNAKFTQKLNELLTRDYFTLEGGETFDTSNIMFIGTQNTSIQYTDNFISRAGAPLFFLPSLSKLSSMEYLFAFVELRVFEFFGNDLKEKKIRERLMEAYSVLREVVRPYSYLINIQRFRSINDDFIRNISDYIIDYIKEEAGDRKASLESKIKKEIVRLAAKGASLEEGE